MNTQPTFNINDRVIFYNIMGDQLGVIEELDGYGCYLVRLDSLVLVRCVSHQLSVDNEFNRSLMNQ